MPGNLITKDGLPDIQFQVKSISLRLNLCIQQILADNNLDTGICYSSISCMHEEITPNLKTRIYLETHTHTRAYARLISPIYQLDISMTKINQRIFERDESSLKIFHVYKNLKTNKSS